MSEASTAPVIDILSAFAPKEASGRLITPELGRYLAEYLPWEDKMKGELSSAGKGLETDKKMHNLMCLQQLRNAEQLQREPNQDDKLFWIKRFNETGENLYGKVNPIHARKIIARQLAEMEPTAPDSSIVKFYNELLGVSTDEEPVLGGTQFEAIQSALFQKFRHVFEVIEPMHDGPYSMSEIRNCLEGILRRQSYDEPAWNKWTITNDTSKNNLSVIPFKREINVPDSRLPITGKVEARGLITHEITHARKAVEGEKLANKMVNIGLPNYLDFEEGLCILFEYLVTGSVPDKVRDRYVDVALASGAIDGQRLSRHELIGLGVSRWRAREKARGQAPQSLSSLLLPVTDHVNRIFRGSDGMPVLDSNRNIIDQAVFNKDLVYYEGFIKARDYFVEELQGGVPAGKIIDFVLQGKFDPTIPSHVEYISQLKAA